MYLGKRLLYILAFADIQKIHVDVDMITKQLIQEVKRVTERLTDKTKDGKWYVCGINEASIMRLRGYGRIIVGLAIDKLSEYETAEDEGRLIITPYKIGKILFLPRRGEVLPFKVVGTRIYENRTEIDLMYCGNNECYRFLSTHPTIEYVEREYFKIREEAEKALKEMK